MKTQLSSVCASCLSVVLLSSAPVGTVYAQFYATCRNGTQQDLEASLIQHSQHIERLNAKFASGFYLQGPMKPDFKPVSLAEVIRGLEQLLPRKAALLHYAFEPRGISSGRLCRWLVSPHTGQLIIGSAVDLSVGELRNLQPDIVDSLRVFALAGARMPRRANEGQPVSSRALDRQTVFERARVALLPDAFIAELERSQVDTLIVLPVFELGAIPFAALPIDDRRTLLNLVSIVVAPGTFVFRNEVRVARATFVDPLVVAYPLNDFGDEASAIAQLLDTNHGSNTKAGLYRHLRDRPRTSMVYIAAHGRADEQEPNDGSFVRLQDGALTSGEVASLKSDAAKSSRRKPLTADERVALQAIATTRPLVVLSACQTGLGKTFDVGNIGLARAWHHAGASNVVMSLWSVYDQSSRELMTRFVRGLRTCPPDAALRLAMLELRNSYPNEPEKWSGFAVFGLPERPAVPNPSCAARS